MRRLRAPLALLLALVAGVSFDLRSVLHAHADWEMNLRAQARARVDGSRTCDSSRHWDRGHFEREAACAACLAAASALDQASATAAFVPAAPRREAFWTGTPSAPVGSPLPHYSGRAPPALRQPA